ncbi:hypothetical protein Bbelb_186920 [Branchiostoma belcheri]|nr:hypothetical protein Bbelb_186920 [Branchiostoma belcheri]
MEVTIEGKTTVLSAGEIKACLSGKPPTPAAASAKKPQNTLTAAYDHQPYLITHKKGTLVTANRDGKETRHTTMLKKIPTTVPRETKADTHDSRADSPGHCAKYGSYTLMELNQRKIEGSSNAENIYQALLACLETHGVSVNKVDLSPENSPEESTSSFDYEVSSIPENPLLSPTATDDILAFLTPWSVEGDGSDMNMMPPAPPAEGGHGFTLPGKMAHKNPSKPMPAVHSLQSCQEGEENTITMSDKVKGSEEHKRRQKQPTNAVHLNRHVKRENEHKRHQKLPRNVVHLCGLG